MILARRTTAAVASVALLATPLAVLSAAPAAAADKEFRYAGAEIGIDVEKDDGRFEIDLDIDDARDGSKWRIVMKHDGKRFLKTTRRADDGDIDLERKRRDTRGKDVFVVKIKRIGADKAVTKKFRKR